MQSYVFARQRLTILQKRQGNTDAARVGSSLELNVFIRLSSFRLLLLPIDAARFGGSHFRNYEDVQKWIVEWIVSKDQFFYRCGIHLLPQTWKKCITSEGKYFD